MWFGNLTKSHTTSCGCAFHDAVTSHGQTRSRTYLAWQNMIARCYRETATGYRNYGGRGIAVCDRWRSSFETFLADMGECPPDLTLDRIDVDGNYEPGNCRWTDWATQARNKRKRPRLTVCGRGHDVSTPDSYYEARNGMRACKQCRRLTERARYYAGSAS
ncbi:MAG: hypothetical protein L0I76_37730 [Pseudonocardia sp.]|nr:hypothetical protein [Pseudonocardia sp.]